MIATNRGMRGGIVTEFVLILPIAMFLIIAAVAMAVLGVRGINAQSAAMHAARVAATFEDDRAALKFNQELGAGIFRGGAIEIKGTGGGGRASNEEEGIIDGYALSNSALDLSSPSIVLRKSLLVPALPVGLGDRVLRGGDTPSPYCRDNGGYSVCGFPE